MWFAITCTVLDPPQVLYSAPNNLTFHLFHLSSSHNVWSREELSTRTLLLITDTITGQVRHELGIFNCVAHFKISEMSWLQQEFDSKHRVAELTRLTNISEFNRPRATSYLRTCIARQAVLPKHLEQWEILKYMPATCLASKMLALNLSHFILPTCTQKKQSTRHSPIHGFYFSGAASWGNLMPFYSCCRIWGYTILLYWILNACLPRRSFTPIVSGSSSRVHFAIIVVTVDLRFNTLPERYYFTICHCCTYYIGPHLSQKLTIAKFRQLKF